MVNIPVSCCGDNASEQLDTIVSWKGLTNDTNKTALEKHYQLAKIQFGSILNSMYLSFRPRIFRIHCSRALGSKNVSWADVIRLDRKYIASSDVMYFFVGYFYMGRKRHGSTTCVDWNLLCCMRKFSHEKTRDKHDVISRSSWTPNDVCVAHAVSWFSPVHDFFPKRQHKLEAASQLETIIFLI